MWVFCSSSQDNTQDNFVLESIAIGIGQEDPLSVSLYTLNNADLLKISGDEEKEDSLDFVDDIQWSSS